MHFGARGVREPSGGRPGAPGEPVAVRKRDAHEALGQFHVFSPVTVPTPGPVRVSSQAHFGARKSRGVTFLKVTIWEAFGRPLGRLFGM